MKFSVKGVENEMKQKYGLRFSSVDGAIDVLEEMICEDINLAENSRQRKEEPLTPQIFKDNNFNALYDSVLIFICNEEGNNGISKHRHSLDRVDNLFDYLTSEARKEMREKEEKEAKESVGPRHAFYDKSVFHLPIDLMDTMRVG